MILGHLTFRQKWCWRNWSKRERAAPAQRNARLGQLRAAPVLRTIQSGFFLLAYHDRARVPPRRPPGRWCRRLRRGALRGSGGYSPRPPHRLWPIRFGAALGGRGSSMMLMGRRRRRRRLVIRPAARSRRVPQRPRSLELITDGRRRPFLPRRPQRRVRRGGWRRGGAAVGAPRGVVGAALGARPRARLHHEAARAPAVVAAPAAVPILDGAERAGEAGRGHALKRSCGERCRAFRRAVGCTVLGLMGYGASCGCACTERCSVISGRLIRCAVVLMVLD